jgi:PAS domain S-box-containing protein
MRFDFISEIKKSLAARIISSFVLLLFIVSFSTASFFLYDKRKHEKLEIIHGGLMLLEVVVLLSKPGLIEESREKLKNEVTGVFWDEDISEVSVYNRNFELLLNKIFKENAAVKGPDKETLKDRKAVFKKVSSGVFPFFFEDKDSFKYYSPVFSGGGVVINTPNLKTNNINLANNEIIGFVYLEKDKSVLKSKTFKATLTFLLLFTVSFLVANAFIFYVARRITKPLDLLTKEVKSLEQGKKTKEINLNTEDEIGKLASAFNRLSKTIKAREKALEETSTQLLMAFEASNEGLYDLDLSTNNVLFSPTWYKMLGYEPYEIPSTLETINELIHPEDRGLVHKAELKFKTQKKERLMLEFRLRTKSGAYKWIASRGKTVEFDSNGKPKRLMGAHIDITELKEAEQQIKELSRKILSAQEIERQKIARELHDNIAQNLSSLKILIQATIAGEADLSYITDTIQSCIKDVRNMSYDLCPPEIDQLGLVRAVAKFCEDFSKREKIKIDFSALGVNEDLLDREININLYRIVQEALNNIKNHAEATSITIKLISSFPEIILRIEDDGKGFDVKKRKVAALSEKRMGLENMKERVRLLSGEIRFQAKKNKGTIIVVKIPYKEESKWSQTKES